jgi:hypothetical protein
MARFTPGKYLIPTVWEAGWAPGSVWMGVEKLASPTVQPVAIRYVDKAIQAHN